jgi:hypothetical protein
MILRADDDIYRARLVYLGPPGYTFPVQLPYAEYGLFAALSSGLITAAVSMTGNWMSSGVALAAAIFLTAYIWQHVDPDRPARKVLLVALTDWRRIGPPPEKLPRLSARHVKFRAEIHEPTGDPR